MRKARLAICQQRGYADHDEADASEEVLARLRQHVPLVGVHRGQRQRHHDDGAHQEIDDDHDAQREEHGSGQLARWVTHVARRIGHDTETLIGDVQQARGEQHADPAVAAVVGEAARVGVG
jgi:hypothetical protein